MPSWHTSRREFLRTVSVGAAGLAAGGTASASGTRVLPQPDIDKGPHNISHHVSQEPGRLNGKNEVTPFVPFGQRHVRDDPNSMGRVTARTLKS